MSRCQYCGERLATAGCVNWQCPSKLSSKAESGPVNLVPVPMGHLLHALGWSGGTVEQVVAEVARLKALDIPVHAEVKRAIAKFPTWPTDPLHALAVLGEEFGELTQAVLEHTYEPEKSSLDDVKKEATHTAAMALRFLDSLDVYVYAMGPQHRQGLGQGVAALLPEHGEAKP